MNGGGCTGELHCRMGPLHACLHTLALIFRVTVQMILCHFKLSLQTSTLSCHLDSCLFLLIFDLPRHKKFLLHFIYHLPTRGSRKTKLLTIRDTSSSETSLHVSGCCTYKYSLCMVLQNLVSSTGQVKS